MVTTSVPGVSWARFEAAAPELAGAVAARFRAHKHHVLATLRPDGSPRVSGTEVELQDGRVRLGSMVPSAKAADLRRDGRCALHAATIDVELVDGDAKLSGVARELPAAETEAMLDRIEAETGQRPPGESASFEVDLTEVVLVRVVGDQLVVQVWTPAGGVREVRRS